MSKLPSNRWKLQDAKNKFSELVERVLEQGPQVVTRHGKEMVVVIAFGYYEKRRKPRQNLIDFFGSSPLTTTDLDLARDRSPNFGTGSKIV